MSDGTGTGAGSTRNTSSPFMLVSVIIPVFNRASTIKRAVESVRRQTYRSIEIIVVDDGSTDDTVAVLAGILPAVHLIKQKNAGPSAARNTGIRASNGDIIAFLDSDDEWLPAKIETQVRLMGGQSGNGTCCCICNATMLYADGQTRTSYATAGLTPTISEGIWFNADQVITTRFLLFNQAIAIRRAALEAIGYFPETLRIMEDYDLALRLSKAGPWAFTRESLVLWHGGATNSLSATVRRSDLPQITYKILADFCASPAAGTLVQSRPIRHRLFMLKHESQAIRLVDSATKIKMWIGYTMLAFLRVYGIASKFIIPMPPMKTRIHERVGQA
ncbi:MAG: glycosyltransferase family A protein [Opitutus sp.]